MAREIARQTGGDLWEIVPRERHTFTENAAIKKLRGEIARGFEAAEAGADDDDVMLRRGVHCPCGASGTAASEVSMRKVKLSCR